MKRLIERRYILRRNMMAIIGICLSVYFSYHLVAGHRGYFRLMALENQMVERQVELAELQIERAEIETKVKMMRPGSIDRDLLEERIRYVLGYHAPDEVVLIQSSNKQL
ncbi:MAG: septum formation initiator family protein [Alphaproteobacteria bacterium]|nr:septum formation initiator family protein [Alphaproteobacteria bacterium]